MKTIIYSILLLVFLVPLSSNAQEQKTIEEPLVGSWLFNNQSSFAKMESKIKAKYDSISTERKQRIESFYTGRKMHFKADGSFEQTLPDGRKSTGTWILNTQTGSIEVTASNGRVHLQKILKLTQTKLVVQPKGINRGIMILPELHFTKL